MLSPLSGIYLSTAIILNFSFDVKADDFNSSMPMYHQIRERVLKNYDKYAQPERHVVPVKTSIHVLRVDLDFHMSKFTVHGWLRERWSDNRLKWDPKKYDNIDTVRFPCEEIWKPEITVANSIEPKILAKDSGLNCLVHQENTSSVLMVHPTVFQVYCNTDVTKWPSGTQFCTIVLETVGSLNTVIYMAPEQDPIGHDLLVDNWEITRTTVNHNIYSKRKSIATLSEVEFCFFIKKAHQFDCFVSFPALAITLLLLSVFWLPPYLTEKFAITGITVVISCLFLILLCRKAPVMLNQTPNIIRFYGCTMCLSAVYLVTSLILFNVSSIHSATMKPLPRTFIKLLNSKFVDYLRISIRKASPVHRGMVNSSHGIRDSVQRNLANEEFAQISYNDQWYQLAAVLDRVMFIVYVLIYMYMLPHFIF